MSSSDRRSRLRAVLTGDRCVTMASVFDPISARFADGLGFEAGLMGGSTASYAVLAAPDVIVLTLSELAEQVHRCTRVSNVPLLVDADHGYGNALNVMRTIRELDDAGAAAVMIEDTLLPRPYGSGDAMQLLPLEESLHKMKAAVAARRESDVVVIGRTSAAAVSGVDDAIARFRAYEAAGVDALFIPALRTRDELDRLSAALTLPLIVGAPAEALMDAGYLASRRARLWSTGHQTFAVAVRALYEAMKAVREGTLSSRLPNVAAKALMDDATGAAEYECWMRAYLGAA
jgi:carboxyvinyl-carboxyphosphonate phosphorylmutase